MALQGPISELVQNASTLIETATETFAETFTETAPEILKETAGETVKEVVTSENAAGLLSTLLEDGSALVNGAWDGLSTGACYVYNNPVEAASGVLETASEFIAENALALGVTVGVGAVTFGGYQAYKNRDKIAEGVSGLAARFGRRNANNSTSASSNDDTTPTDEKRSSSSRLKPSSSSSSSSNTND